MTEPRFDDEFRELIAIAYRVGFRLLGDRGAAEDVAQETVARAYERWARIAPYRAAWVARVSGNLAIDQLRHRRPPIETAGGSSVELERVDLQRALLALPRRQREAIVLRYLADLSEVDVATALGCSPGSVKSHLSRGTRRLRVLLADNGGT